MSARAVGGEPRTASFSNATCVCVCAWAYPRVHSFVSISMLAWCDLCVRRKFCASSRSSHTQGAREGRQPKQSPRAGRVSPALLQPSPVSTCNRACVWWVLLWVGGWMGGCMHMRMCMWLVYIQVAPLTAMCDQVLYSDQVARLPATHDFD